MAGYVSQQAVNRWNRTAKIVADGNGGFGVGAVPFAESGELPLIFKNVSGIEIPPFACVQLTGTTESGDVANYVNATRPVDATGHAGPFGFNGPTRVQPGELGSLQAGPVYHAIYDSGVQTAGRKYHPIKDSFKLKGAGFGAGCGVWAYVGTDDIIADTIRVKACGGGGEVACQELADLVAGTYRGICGATIAPGETGGVIVSNCNGDAVVIDAVNHTNCTFYVGERISVHITPCCTAHFDGCSCCTEPTICQTSIVVCICGETQVLAVNGGTYTWDVSECCDCEGATLEVTLSCSTGPDLIEADWLYTCGESTQSGTITLTSLFNLSADVEIIDQLDALCDGYLLDRWANFAEPCATVTDPCCFCATYESAGVDKIGGLSGGNIAVDLAMNRTTWCNGDTVTYTLSCTNNAGGPLDIRPILHFGPVSAISITASTCGRYSIDSTTPTHATAIATPIAGDCEADSPASITWADVSVAAGATIERSATVTWVDVADTDGDGGSAPQKITAHCVILSGTGNYRAMTRVCDNTVRCGNAVAGGGDEGAPGGAGPGGEGGGI